MKLLKIFLPFILLVCLLFSSCSAKRYADDIDCKRITDTLKKEVLFLEEYSEYTSADIEFLFPNCSHFNSCSIIYSDSGDDIGEFGILHSSSEDEASMLLEDVNAYIKSINEEKRTFLKNYMPNEISKLDNATVKQFGNYVAFAVLDIEQSKTTFDKVENMLKK